ncbi:MAG: solute/DNA competence effector protein [Halomonas sp. 54_146]|nr:MULTISPECIES: ProQ/FINO family protein [unclassified Halomonas]KUJ86848.1 MAG: solute/DNA competence effector protein [Halomonas sp. 54_146]HAA44184.1 ABC transporter substrate-binding protein [Halomonas sp.]
MAASLMKILDDLETRLERTQAELEALREENQRLKQQLALQDAQAKSVPSSKTATTSEMHSLEAPEQSAPSEQNAPEEQASPEPAGSPPVAEPLVAEPLVAEAVSETAPATGPAPSPHALLNQWYERYPKAFFKGHTKPLKVGIHQELAEREEWPNKLIRRALANYVNLPRYIKAVREGAERVDLDGQPAGKVDKQAALHAAEKRGDKKSNEQTKKAPPKPTPVAPKPRQVAVKQAGNEKSESHKPLSMEDKLLDLQQKFKAR